MSALDAGLQPLTVPNLREQIEGQVREAILSGAFRPGERLVESAIAEQLGVSRAPVREVLSALERDGLVINIPRRGYFVISFTEEDIEEIYSLRLLAEVAGLERAFDRFTEEHFAEMEEILGELGRALVENDRIQVVGLDGRFHEYIMRLADHSRLYWVWNSMRYQTEMLMGVTSKTYISQPSQPVEIHQGILDAIRSGAVEKAEQCLREHFEDAEQRARRSLQIMDANARAAESADGDTP